MSHTQRITLLVGIAAITILCLRPPYAWEQTTYLLTGDSGTPHRIGSSIKSIEHRWIWSTPEKGIQQGYMSSPETNPYMEFSVARVDWLRLAVYAGLAAAITLCLAFGVFQRKRKDE